jgi:hypothetical protein
MKADGVFDATARVRPVVWVLFLLLVAILIAGTLQIPLLTNVYFALDLPLAQSGGLLDALAAVELSPQGALLIVMLLVIGVLAWKGFENIFDRYTRWTYSAVAAIAITVLIAAPVEAAGSLSIGFNGRFFAEVGLLAAVGYVVRRSFTKDELSGWIWETWKFVKQIFPLLIIGVFLAGIVKVIIPETWVRTLAGQNTIWANMVGVVFGVFMYFPTLVEVPLPGCSWTWAWHAARCWLTCWRTRNCRCSRSWCCDGTQEDGGLRFAGAQLQFPILLLNRRLTRLPETVQPDIIMLPLIGAIDLSRQSLLVSTLLISFVDGFNPCSIWVLTMLLAITLHSGSRKKIIIVGSFLSRSLHLFMPCLSLGCSRFSL